MSLLIHTEGKNGTYNIQWATKSGSVGGVMDINFQTTGDDQKALAEIFALNILLDRYPGKAPCIMTSQGALKKLLRGAERFAATEIASLKIKHRSLKIESGKKIHQHTQAALDSVTDKIIESFEWSGLGRPSVRSSIGLIEITSHAMERYRERLCPTGSLPKLQALLSREIYVAKSSRKNGMVYNQYSVPEVGFRFIVAAKESNPSQQRMTTCYAI
jgi:hypothetical protein